MITSNLKNDICEFNPAIDQGLTFQSTDDTIFQLTDFQELQNRYCGSDTSIPKDEFVKMGRMYLKLLGYTDDRAIHRMFTANKAVHGMYLLDQRIPNASRKIKAGAQIFGLICEGVLATAVGSRMGNFGAGLVNGLVPWLEHGVNELFAWDMGLEDSGYNVKRTAIKSGAGFTMGILGARSWKGAIFNPFAVGASRSLAEDYFFEQELDFKKALFEGALMGVGGAFFKAAFTVGKFSFDKIRLAMGSEGLAPLHILIAGVPLPKVNSSGKTVDDLTREINELFAKHGGRVDFGREIEQLDRILIESKMPSAATKRALLTLLEKAKQKSVETAGRANQVPVSEVDKTAQMMSLLTMVRNSREVPTQLGESVQDQLAPKFKISRDVIEFYNDNSNHEVRKALWVRLYELATDDINPRNIYSLTGNGDSFAAKLGIHYRLSIKREKGVWLLEFIGPRQNFYQ